MLEKNKIEKIKEILTDFSRQDSNFINCSYNLLTFLDYYDKTKVYNDRINNIIEIPNKNVYFELCEHYAFLFEDLLKFNNAKINTNFEKIVFLAIKLKKYCTENIIKELALEITKQIKRSTFLIIQSGDFLHLIVYKFNNDNVVMNNYCIIIHKFMYSSEIKKVFSFEKSNIFSKNIPLNRNKTIPIDYRVLKIKIEDLNINNKIKDKLKRLNVYTIDDFINLNSNFLLKNRLGEYIKTEIYKELAQYDILQNVKYSPVNIELPKHYYKSLDNFFNEEIFDILKKYKIKNIGLFANQFPNILINDEELMENPKSFEYIDKITKILASNGITDCPLKLSCF